MRNRNGTAVEGRAEPSQAQNGAEERRPGKFIVILIAAYAFIVASRILDISSVGRLHIPMMLFILIALVTLALLIQHGVQGLLNNKASFCFAALTAWVIVAYPLSEWRAYSWPYVQATVQGLALFTAVVQIACTMENWRRIAAMFGYAVITASILSFTMGEIKGGRLSVGAGTLADPNIFALFLVIGLPLLLYTAWSSSTVKRIALYGSSVFVLCSFARAGSRGGLIAFAAMLFVLFILGKPSQKAMIMALGIVGLVAASMFLPSYLKDRFTTFFSTNDQVSGATENRLDSDIASSEERKSILIQSIHITFQHPLLGVGPGVFPWIAAEQRIKETGHSGWAVVTHNTYTQYSSETGLPGFFFWVGTLYFCIKYLLQVYRKSSGGDEQLRRAARDALAAMSGLAVGSFFLSLGYALEIPILLGLAVALHNIGETATSTAQLPGTGEMLAAPAVGFEQPAFPQTKRKNPLPRRKPGRPDLSGRPRARNFD